MLLRHEKPEEWRTDLGLALVSKGIQWRARYTKKLQNRLITEAFENAKAAAELLMPNSPAAPKGLKTRSPKTTRIRAFLSGKSTEKR